MQKNWQTLTPAPDPVRGGTSLAAVTLMPNYDVLLRYGGMWNHISTFTQISVLPSLGFSGYELPDNAGEMDIYSIENDQWLTVLPKEDATNGVPGCRSVHGFVPFTSSSPDLGNAVALLYHGERDASTLGHAGAGTFWSDLWLLQKDRNSSITHGWEWRKVEVKSDFAPEGRGWFPSAYWVDSDGETKVVLQGGLLSSNERSDETWLFEIA